MDLLFIDTWHVYAHLRRELAHHHAGVRNHIILHDTEGDHTLGESVRLNQDVTELSRRAGYDPDEVRKGLWPAVEEFLDEHPEWELEAHFRNNNGLTVLHRRGNTLVVTQHHPGLVALALLMVLVAVLAYVQRH